MIFKHDIREVIMGGKSKKVLIIDDDADFVASTGTVLKKAGYEVIEAFSGQEGLQKSKSDKPDLYIIDMMMETYSEGSNVVHALSEDKDTQDKPRIMITSIDMKGPWESYAQDQSLGCYLVLQKPVSPKQLLESVENALRWT
jgi:CheY-like chemotaxis protein